MSESTRLGRARGRMLPVSIVAAALVALLVIVPVASAATPNPVASGTTTITIKSNVLKSLKKAGVTLTAVKPAKLKGSKLTMSVTGGSIEATTGGTTNLAQGGGLKIKAGKKSVALKGFVLSTKTKTLSAKLGGKTVKLASLGGVSSSRLGFGNSIAAKKVTLTAAGAKALNKNLAPAKKKGQKAAKPAFKANTLLGASTTTVEPETDNVLATGTMAFTGNVGLLGKLQKAGVTLEVIAPTTANNLTFTSPLSGGTVSPLGTSGTINSSGGLKLTQKLNLEALHQEANTSITLGSIGVDLAAKTAGVEVIGESTFVEPGSNPAKKPLNLGNLGRSSIADLTISSTPSPATRTVTVSATGTIQPVAAEVLNGFVKVHMIKKIEELTPEEAKKAFVEAIEKGSPISEAEAAAIGQKKAEEKAATEAKELEIKSGETLGSFSFVATGE